MTSLRVFLFGPFKVFREGQPLTTREWRSQQTRTILKVLLARHGRVVPADQLLDILWPDQDPTAARRRLYVRISQLRKALNPGEPSACILTVEGGYSFKVDADCWVDVFEFEAHARQGRRCQERRALAEAIAAYEAARALYRGDLLEEDLYEDWAFTERERLRECFLNVLTELAECYAQQGRYRRAIARCHQLLAADPCREAIYVRLMLYHYYAGEQAQALRTYERCRQVLAHELEVEPMPTTATLVEKIRDGTLWAGADAPRYPPPAYKGRLFEVPYSLGHAPFVGREREYAWLIEQWRDANTHIILIEGEAGVGKSRLANEFLGYAAAEGATVLQSRAVSGETQPFASAIAALRSLLEQGDVDTISPEVLAALAPLFPELGHQYPDLLTLPKLPARQEQQRLFSAVKAWVETQAPVGTLLYLDDAHRADRVSVELLTHLAGPLTLVLACRSEETPVDHPLRLALRPLRQLGRVAGLILQQLTPAASRKLIRQLARPSAQADDDLLAIAERVLAQSGGNPLFVIALLQHLFETGVLYVDAAGQWAVAEDEPFSLPSAVRETIEARLRHLGREERRIFDQAAVLGGEFDFVLLQQASQEPEGLLLKKLDALLEVGLLVEPRTVGRAEFALAHDLYAEVAYATLPQVRRRQLHRRAAEAIEQVYAADPSIGLAPFYASLAHHYHRAQDAARERRYAGLAGEQAAARFANAEAVTWLSRALELTPEADVAERHALLLTREKVYDVQGAREAQIQDLETLEMLTKLLDDDERRAQVALRWASYAWVTSDFEAMAAAAQEAIHLAQSCRAIELEARGSYYWGRALSWLGEYEGARQRLESALALARTVGDCWMEADIVRNLGTVFFSQNRMAQCVERFEQALSLHRQIGDRRGELGALNNLALAVARLGEHSQSRAYLEQARVICGEIGDRFAEATLLFNLAVNFQRQGEYTIARGYYEKSLAIRREIGAREGEGETLTYLGELFRQQGDYARAQTHFEQARCLFHEMGDRRRQARALRGLGLVQLDWGSYDQAKDLLERALNALQEADDHEETESLANLSRLFRLAGDEEMAHQYGRQALTVAQKRVDLHSEGVAWTSLGHALAGLGRLTEATDVYRQALAMRREMGECNLAMDPLAGLARVALAQGELAQAQEYVEEILTHLKTETPSTGSRHSLDGVEEPCQVYLTCWQVLEANQDPRAQEILDAAYRLLQGRAATIEAEEDRRSYLEVVATHREIVQQYSLKSPSP